MKTGNIFKSLMGKIRKSENNFESNLNNSGIQETPSTMEISLPEINQSVEQNHNELINTEMINETNPLLPESNFKPEKKYDPMSENIYPLPQSKFLSASTNLRPVIQDSDDMSLEREGIDRGAISEGNKEVLKASLYVVVKNYLVEIKAAEDFEKQTLRDSVLNKNREIIACENQINYITSFQIPEQSYKIDQFRIRISEIESRYTDRYTLPETHTLLNLAISDAQHGIRLLNQKLYDLGGQIKQLKMEMDGLQNKSHTIVLNDPDVLIRRLNIFFRGWLMSLSGMNFSESEIAIHKQILHEHMNSLFVAHNN